MIILAIGIILLKIDNIYYLFSLIIRIKFLINKFSFINNLILLELHIILNFIILIFILKINIGSLYMVFITFSVCEATLGLGLLIYISRRKSTDILKID